MPTDHKHVIAPRFNLDQADMAKTTTGRKEEKKSVSRWPETPQERAGIMIHYPGISETKERYPAHPVPVSEVLDNHGGLCQCQPGYQINPRTEIVLPGWSKQLDTGPQPADKSEYVSNYRWPDGRLIQTALGSQFNWSN
ncbi:unnamed protein product [Echinostoma caproni]|uniref:Rhs family protein n=1 Tax=Echinostoma caproni TaxID=27848 RepID=A0A183APH1_9TREM|nr:unnamed protein product [Echinostoma caproni]